MRKVLFLRFILLFPSHPLLVFQEICSIQVSSLKFCKSFSFLPCRKHRTEDKGTLTCRKTGTKVNVLGMPTHRWENNNNIKQK
jgi:hypothetical protein